MRATVRHQLLILGVGALVFFVNLGATRLWDQDEAYFARTAVEMHQRGEWVVPYFNDEMFAHKPPLMYWLMRSGFLLFGVNEFAARFWSAAFGIGTALLTYRLGRRMFNPRVGLWAGLAMCTALNLVLVDRAATPDSLLIFFSTLALYLFARRENWHGDNLEPTGNGEGGIGTTALRASFSMRWPTWVGIYAAMGAAVLVKGPIGVLLPGATLGLYLLVRDQPENWDPADSWTDRFRLMMGRFAPAQFFRAFLTMRPLLAMLVVLAIAGPWYALVGLRTEGNFLTEFFGVQNYGRFVGSMDGHSGGYWYYLPAILVGFFPWSIFAFSTIVLLVQRCWGSLPEQRGAKLLACWVIVFVGFFSLAGTKLPNYVLPVYPALALATACYLDRWMNRSEIVGTLWMKLSLASLLLVGLATAVGTTVLGHSTASGKSLLERWGAAPEVRGELSNLAWLGVVLSVGGILAFALLAMNRRRAMLGSLVATATLFALGAFGVVAVHLDRYQPSPALANAISEHASGKPRVAQFGYFRPSLVYYTDGRVEPCKTPQRVVDFLQQSDNNFLVTTADQYDRLSAQLPADVAVLCRQTDFPHRAAVVLLGRQNAVAQRAAGTKQ